MACDFLTGAVPVSHDSGYDFGAFAISRELRIHFSMPQQAVPIALIALAIYSVHDALIKHLGQTYSVIQIVFFASLFTFPLFSIWLVGSRQLQSLKPANPWAVGFRSVAMAINILAAFYAFQVLPMGQAYALLFTAPLIVTALSGPILRERVDGASWVAVALGFVGVIVVLQPKAQGISLGHIAALTAALVSAMNSVLVRKLGTSERSVVLLLYPMMTTLLAMALLLPMVYRPMALGDLGITAAIAVMSITAGVLTIQAYRRGRAAIIAPMQYSQMIWGVIFGYAFFSESPAGHTLVGAAIIILSGVFIVSRDQSPPIAQETVTHHATQIARLTRLFAPRRRD